MSAISRGALENTTVQSDGWIFVGYNGTASDTTLSSGARVNDFRYIGAGTQKLDRIANSQIQCDFSSAVVSSGWSGDVGAEGRVTAIQVLKGGRLYVSGLADGTVVDSLGNVLVRDGGVANGTLISKGATVSAISRGVVKNTTIQSEGFLLAGYNGTASNTTILAGGSLTIENRHCGNMQIDTGAVVSAVKNAKIVFDLEYRDPAETAMINDLSLIQGAPSFTITVAVDQLNGSYKLAAGAAGFNKTVTISDLDGVTANVNVGNTVTVGNLECSLILASDQLSLTVSGGSPAPCPGKMAAGDLNMDGRADIVMTIDQSTHPANGATGAWLIKEDQTPIWGDLSTRNGGWEIFGMGKTDAGKNTNDVYIKSDSNIVGAWTTDNDGKVTGWETIGSFDSDAQVLGLGDFNGNGQSDLLLRAANGAVGCFFTNGQGWNYFQSLGDEWKLTAIGDLNGDGRDDVVLKHDAGFAGSWLTQADGTPMWADLDTLPDGFEIVGAGDFNGDGTDDVLLKNGGYYGAWLVQNGNAVGWFGIGDLGDATVEQIADFNGDGKDDLRIRTAAGDLGAQLVMGADTLDWHYYGSVGAEWSTGLAALS